MGNGHERKKKGNGGKGKRERERMGESDRITVGKEKHRMAAETATARKGDSTSNSAGESTKVPKELVHMYVTGKTIVECL